MLFKHFYLLYHILLGILTMCLICYNDKYPCDENPCILKVIWWSVASPIPGVRSTPLFCSLALFLTLSHTTCNGATGSIQVKENDGANYGRNQDIV